MRQVFWFVTLLAVCSVPAATAFNAEVVEAGNALILRWSPAETVDIYQLSSPDDKKGQRIARQVSTGGIVVPSDGDTRHYYRVQPKKGRAVVTALRLLPLEGGRNFRDVGGYTTTDGRRVRWGHLYRSGMMAGLTMSDYEYLSALGIKVVCDLRASEEREQEPTRWQTTPQARYMSWDYPSESSSLMAGLFAGGVPTPDETRAAMLDTYHEIAYEHAPRYEYIFDQLAAGEIPLAFNCSAGKDRAGVGTALILAALGVEEEQIVTDYSLSEQYVDYMKEFRDEADPESPYAFLAQLPEEVLAPMLRSDPDYLRETFRVLKAKHGSVLAFIQEELNVTDEELDAIRNALLES